MLRDINSKLGDAREDIFQSHHENTDAFEKAFRLETSAVIEVFKFIGKLFLERKSYLIHITTKHMLDDKTPNSVRIAEQIISIAFQKVDYVMQALLCMTTYKKTI